MSIGLPPSLNGALGCCVNNNCGGQGGPPPGPGGCSPTGSNCGTNGSGGIGICNTTGPGIITLAFNFTGSSGNDCSGGGGSCGAQGGGSGIILFSMSTCTCTSGIGGQNGAGGNGPAGFCPNSGGSGNIQVWEASFAATNSFVASSMAVCPPAL